MKSIFREPNNLEDKKPRKVKSETQRSESWIEGLLQADGEAPQTENERELKSFLPFFVAALFCFLLLLSRLYQLQIVQGSKYLKEAEGNRLREKVIRAPRGIIYDQKNRALVENVPNFEVLATPGDLPKEKEKRQEIYKKISLIIGTPETEIEEITESKGLDSFQSILVNESITREEALILESKIKEFPGFEIGVSPVREYKDSTTISHILGYAGRISEEEYSSKKDIYDINDFIGKSGLERSYEEYLKGKNGKERVEVDAYGKVVKVLGANEEETGNNLILSLDLDLQKKLTEYLANGIGKAKAEKGSAVAINPQNGEILAMVSIPTFDNNLFSKGISPEDYNNLIGDPANPLFFRAIGGIYPSGSTIKPFVASAGLEEGIITKNTTVTDSGPINIGEWSFPDWAVHGTVNVIRAIAISCNIFFYHVGGGYGNIVGLGVEKLAEYLSKFGFGKPTEVDLPEEAQGQIPDPAWKEETKGEPWYLGDTYHMAIGQGDVLVTPLQMANATASIANGGTLFKPHLVRKITDLGDNLIKEIGSEVLNKDFINSGNISIVREGMREAVVSGSARMLSSLPVAAAGKTGTAEFGTGKEKHAWFSAFAPFDNPQVAMSIIIEGGGEGSTYAVPVANDFLKYYFTKQ